VIGKVNRGSDAAGLIRYLFGPGRENEHLNAHVVDAFDGLVGVSTPTAGEMARMLDRPNRVLLNPYDKHVWHCSLRAAPEDRALTDSEWADACRTILARTGFDTGVVGEGCRWIAVRHASDHVHLVVTLARENGTRPSVGNDFYKVGLAAREVEGRFGLRVTAPVDRTAVTQVKRAEVEKAARVGEREASRTVLRREVRTAAAMAATPEEFFRRLDAAGVLVKLRYSEREPGVVTGFAVAMPTQLTATGALVFYSGGKLGPELTWPQLSTRWNAALAGSVSGQSAGPLVEGIAGRFGSLLAGEAADVIVATGDVLISVARRAEGVRGLGPYHETACRFQRAIRDPYERRPEPSRHGGELRAIARAIATGPRTPTVDLVVALLRLLDVVGQHRTHQGQVVQAEAVTAARQHFTPTPAVSQATMSPAPTSVTVERHGLRP
jgi:hypothetical protein